MPGAPIVLLQWALTGIFFAPYIRSRLDMSLVTAAIISAVRPARDTADHVGGGGVRQDPFTELPHRPILDLVVDGLVDSILDDAR